MNFGQFCVVLRIFNDLLNSCGSQRRREILSEAKNDNRPGYDLMLSSGVGLPVRCSTVGTNQLYAGAGLPCR